MKRIVTFRIFKGEDGYYVAVADEFGIYTQGKTFEELLAHIREATEVTFEDAASGGTDEHALPPIMMNIDFSEVTYAA